MGGRAIGRTYGHLITEISPRMDHIFLGLRRSEARVWSAAIMQLIIPERVKWINSLFYGIMKLTHRISNELINDLSIHSSLEKKYFNNAVK